jgi:hypothetical protein
MTSSEFLAYPNLPLSDKRTVRRCRTFGKFGAFAARQKRARGTILLRKLSFSIRLDNC